MTVFEHLCIIISRDISHRRRRTTSDRGRETKKKKAKPVLQNAAIIDGIFFIFFSNTQECCCCCRKSNKVHTCTKVWLTTGGGCFLNWSWNFFFYCVAYKCFCELEGEKKNKDNYSFFLHFFSCLFVLFRFFV